MKKSRMFIHPCPEHQEHSVTTIASPASGTKYEWKAGVTGSGAVLGTQKNARIISIAAKVTWTVQPSPIEVHITVDNIEYTFTFNDPVSTQNYTPIIDPTFAPADQLLRATSTTEESRGKAYLLEGREIKVEAETTGGTVSELKMRVIWGQW